MNYNGPDKKFAAAFIFFILALHLTINTAFAQGRREGENKRGPRIEAQSPVKSGATENRSRREGGNRNEKGGPGRNNKREPEVFLTDIPKFAGNIILGRPTDHSITLSIVMRDTAKIIVSYWQSGKEMKLKTAPFELQAGLPREIMLENLSADTAYEYRVLNGVTGDPLIPENGNGSFHTCRAPGSAFTFTVQADPHLDGRCATDVYKNCLANALNDKPDFHIDLGDTFMTGKHQSRSTAALQYTAQRYYFGLIGHAAPIFLVIGNHDGEEAERPGASDVGGLAVWSCEQRKRYFPNPVPDQFYTGNTEKHPNAGLLQNYYSWTWDDALFIALDPYWTSRSTRGWTEPWNMSIGKTQFDWLARTLRASNAKYKFVFIHQLTGGLGNGGRGGSEAAPLYEWGGHETDGKDTFAANRPGWEKPIQNLLVENKVNIVFHGHDHFYARQELGGVIYQLVPQPSQPNRRDHAEEYGYIKGDFLPSAGHIRVNVSPEKVTVDYIQAAAGEDMKRQGMVNGRNAFSYTCGTKR